MNTGPLVLSVPGSYAWAIQNDSIAAQQYFIQIFASELGFLTEKL